MMNIRQVVLTALCCSLASTAVLAESSDTYVVKFMTKVPRIYDNMQSLGYRKYQSQLITGYLTITYPDATEENPSPRPRIEITDLYNKTHKINGRNITYGVIVNNDGEDYVYGPRTRVNRIGSNKTGKFDTASIVFYMDANPSYNIGDDVEDNALLMTAAGSGKCKSFKHYEYQCINGRLKKVMVGKCDGIYSVTGNTAGQIGCGCMAYGHTSPTRVADQCGATRIVDDIAAIFGSWRMYYSHSTCDCD